MRGLTAGVLRLANLALMYGLVANSLRHVDEEANAQARMRRLLLFWLAVLAGLATAAPWGRVRGFHRAGPVS